MDKAAILLPALLILLTVLCATPRDTVSPAEQGYLSALSWHNQSLGALKEAMDSGDYTEIRRAISKYNASVHEMAAKTSALCADGKLAEKYKKTCSQEAILERCNVRDVEGTTLIMKIVHDPAITNADCGRLLALIDEQEECRSLAQSYVPAMEDREKIQRFCAALLINKTGNM